jgi:hypothetical protein
VFYLLLLDLSQPLVGRLGFGIQHFPLFHFAPCPFLTILRDSGRKGIMGYWNELASLSSSASRSHSTHGLGNSGISPSLLPEQKRGCLCQQGSAPGLGYPSLARLDCCWGQVWLELLWRAKWGTTPIWLEFLENRTAIER